MVEQTKNGEARITKTLQIAAFLGEEIARYAGGSWFIYPEAHGVRVENLNCYAWPSYAPIDNARLLWSPKGSTVRAEYKNMVHSKLPLTDDEIKTVISERSRMSERQ